MSAAAAAHNGPSATSDTSQDHQGQRSAAEAELRSPERNRIFRGTHGDGLDDGRVPWHGGAERRPVTERNVDADGERNAHSVSELVGVETHGVGCTRRSARVQRTRREPTRD